MSIVKGTHEEFMPFPGGGYAIVTGVPDKCEHDDKLNVFMLANGGHLFEIDHRCPTDEATLEYVNKKAAEMGTTIVGGTCACSKCRKVLSLRDLMGEAYDL